MKRISPTKQNQAPLTMSSPNKARKGGLAELVAFVRSTGMVLPQHLAKFVAQADNPQSPAKQTEAKRLKVQLTDALFELKKVEEDFAEFKRTVKNEREKEGKKWEESTNRLRESLQNNSEDSVFKIKQLEQKYESALKECKDKHNLQLQQQLGKLRDEMEKKLQGEERLRRRQTAEMQRNFDRRLNEVKDQYENQIAKSRKDHTDQLREINLRHKQVIDEKERRHDSLCTALQSEKKIQERLHEKSKVEFAKEKEKLISEMCYENNLKRQLQEDLAQREKEIKGWRSKVNDLEISLVLKEEKHAKKIAEAESLFNQCKLVLESEKRDEIKEMLSLHTLQIESYLTKLSSLQDSLREKQQLWKQQIEEVSQMFQRRPSKREDLGELERLRYLLGKREEEIRKLRGDLKHCNLELENKEEIYNRIFRVGRQERKSLQKEEKQAQLVQEKLGKQIFRKSQTADIKFLMKVYNNK